MSTSTNDNLPTRGSILATVNQNAPVFEMGIYHAMRLAYNASRACGWHADKITGEPHSAAETDAKFPERIALTHSELSEALEGHRKGKMDDHLPHRPSAEVELADAVIRAFDLAAAMGYDLPGAFVEKISYNMQREDHTTEARKQADGKRY